MQSALGNEIEVADHSDDAIDPDSDDLDESIDYNLLYARHTFVANLEGQVCVLKGDSMELLDDSNAYWWLVKTVKTDEIGYIPAENTETPFERLARLNSVKNVQMVLPTSVDTAEVVQSKQGSRPNIRINEVPDIFEDYDADYYDYEEGEFDDGDEGSIDSAAGVVNAATSSAITRGYGATGSPGNHTPPLGDFTTSNANGGNLGKSLGSIGQNLFQKFWKLGGKRPTPTKSYSADAADRNELESDVFRGADASRQSVQQEEQLQGSVVPTRRKISEDEANSQSNTMVTSEKKKAINVLRIYAGNVDLKATFKTVAITRTMTVDQLLEQCLKRFRVEGKNEYYLSVLHFDSLERRLSESDIVMDALERLVSKHLPGSASKRLSIAGGSSAVCLTDENIIKVIVNKKLNMYEKNYHLVRVFMYDEMDPSIRTYKTIGANSDAMVKDIIDISLKKFKLPAVGYRFRLTSVFKEKETILNDSEKLHDILKIAVGSAEEIDFILDRDPLPDTDVSNREEDSLSVAIMASINSKPTFLEDSNNSLGSSLISSLEVALLNSQVHRSQSEPGLKTLSDESPHTSTMTNSTPRPHERSIIIPTRSQSSGISPIPTLSKSVSPHSQALNSPSPPISHSPDINIPPRRGSSVIGGSVLRMDSKSLLKDMGNSVVKNTHEQDERKNESKDQYTATSTGGSDSKISPLDPSESNKKTISPSRISDSTPEDVASDTDSCVAIAASSVPAKAMESVNIHDDFNVMEKYLAEIMKEDVDPVQIEMLQESLRSSNSSRLSLRDQLIMPDLSASISQVSYSNQALTRSPKLKSRPQSILKDTFDGRLERDIEKSKGTTLEIPPINRISERSQSHNDSTPFSLKAKLLLQLQESDRAISLATASLITSTFSDAPDSSPRLEAVDSLNLVEMGSLRFKEVDMALNNLQRELDSICAVAYSLYSSYI